MKRFVLGVVGVRTDRGWANVYICICIYIYICMYIYVYSTHIHNNIPTMHGTHTKRRYTVYLHNVHTYYT